MCFEKDPIIASIWKDGKIIDPTKANDHSFNHSKHYGTWVFEGLRFYETDKGSKIFRLNEHIDRLMYSASYFDYTLKYLQDDIKKACLEVVKQSGLVSGYIRPIIYPGASVWLDPTDAEIHTEVSAVPFPSYLWEKPIRVKIAKTRRVDPRTVDMGAKICGNYINSARAKLEVKKQKFDEWLLLDTSDNIAEGPGANIFFIAKAGSRKVYTPQLWTILPGITRATIMQLFKDKYGVEVIEETISPERLWEFSEAFFVWTAAEVTPIASITNEQNKQFDFLSCEDDSLSNQMKKIYLDVVSGKDSDYLTYLS